MKFIDEASITVCSGNGGHGCVSFRRERFVPKGGPDGGDGGRGGSIIFQTTTRQRTLHAFKRKSRFSADNGTPGQGKQKTGKSGQDLVIELPPGTIIREAETGRLIKDLAGPSENFLFLEGGRGGKGNKHFTSATNRAPRFAQPGEPGVCADLILELKLLADIGLIGLPNAGKSSLLSVISAARPAIENYPFTTLTPNLGMVQIENAEPFAVADIPGLIEGSHSGVGLGTTFLKHIERTRFLVHVVDAAALDPDQPLATLETINRELALFSPKMAAKPQVLALNKLDLPQARENMAPFLQAISADQPCFQISTATMAGINDLKKHLLTLILSHHDSNTHTNL